MALLHVRAHWSNALPPGPPPAAPVPGWTSAYPGTVPLVPFTPGPPPWPSPPTGPVGGAEYDVWVPLVAMATLDSVGWSFGPSWAGSPPPAWPTSSGVAADTYDEGYPAGATGFIVNRLRLFQESLPGTDHVYRVADPAGNVIGTVTSTGPGWTLYLNVTGPMTDRQGIWTVRITRAGGSSVAAPGLFPDAASPGNTVDEPYVSPYGNPFEGVLGVEFDGTAIVPSACWDDIAVSHPDPIPCAPPGGTVHLSFSAAVTPATPAYAGPYLWRLLRGMTVLQPWTSGTAAFDRDLPAGVDYKVSVRVQQPDSCPEGDLLDAFTFTVPACTPCAIAIGKPPPIPCSTGGTTTAVQFTASTTMGYSGPFTWEVFDLSNPDPQAPPISQATSGTTFSTTFPGPGRYRVTVSFATQGCPNKTASNGVDVIVPDCNCPILTGTLTATATSPCQYEFAVGVTLPPGKPVTYAWNFGDGTTTTTSTPATTHTYTGNGPRHVTVRITATGCADVDASTDLTVSGCTPAGTPPHLGGCSLVAGAGTGSVTITFDQAVDAASASNASNYSVSINGGAIFTPAAGSVSYDAAARSATITGLTINPGNSVEVRVSGLTSATGVTMPATETTSCSAPGGPPVDPTPPTSFCAALLWTALILILAGSALAVVGCVIANWFPQAGLVLQIIGAALFVIGWLAFGLWLLFCSATTACQVLLAVRTFVAWLIGVFAGIAVVLFFLGFLFPSFRLCAGYAFAAGLNWGAIRVIIDGIAYRNNCLIENPNG